MKDVPAHSFENVLAGVKESAMFYALKNFSCSRVRTSWGEDSKVYILPLEGMGWAVCFNAL